MKRTITGNKQKVFYVISHVHKSLAFEWIASRLKKHYDLTFILLNDRPSAFEQFLKENEIPTYRLHYASKKHLPVVFLRLLWMLIKVRPQVVHAHLFDATLIGLAAAWIARIKKRIYTRHNSTYHHLYHPAAVKYDRFTNFLATKIVSISQATDVALMQMENTPPHKIVKIPHGFDLSDFVSVDPARVDNVRNKWGVPSSGPRVGVIARHIEWKGIQYIIPAFEALLRSHPDAVLIFANASGPYHQTILQLLKNIPQRNCILIPFEEDVAALYKLFDVYVHTPIDPTCEAFGQTYIESLAAGVPSVFTPSGIAKEFVVHTENSWVVPFKDSEAITAGLKNLLQDQQLRARLIENGREIVFSRFGIDEMIDALRKLYDK